jgi:pantoate--beta-alanine ligase
MNRDLNLGVSIVTVPTVRDVDGVAFSSRNKYLSNSERKAARVLYQSLLAVQEVKSSSVDDLKNAILKLLTKEPLIQIDYVNISDPDTLEEISVVNKKCLVSIAVYVGKVRLIDNFLLDNTWR